MIGISILLAFVVLFNLTNINVAERIRELSTIKVLGFFNKEVTLYIYRETIYLSIIGILVEFGLGLGLHQYMVDVIPPENIMFNPNLGSIISVVGKTTVGIIELFECTQKVP
ncbi:ABC transporter permease [Streptococcus thermophilus]|uniref:FtsX-like permease family protein n=1 Tax=Streptococcus thermophilus TaxID=1308 RepID=UPI001E47BC11|nr:ABC transporter permease [Streptococcus thermophilus]